MIENYIIQFILIILESEESDKHKLEAIESFCKFAQDNQLEYPQPAFKSILKGIMDDNLEPQRLTRTKPIERSYEPRYPLLKAQSFLKPMRHKQDFENCNLVDDPIFATPILDTSFLDQEVTIKYLLNKLRVQGYFGKPKK